MPDVLAMLRILMNEKGISEYKLSQLSGVPQSTINSFFRKNNTPSFNTMQSLCKPFNLTLSQFIKLAEDKYGTQEYALNEPAANFDSFYDVYSTLTTNQKELVFALMVDFSTK